MSIELSPQWLQQACTQRPDYPFTVMQTREALATFYEGMALRRLITAYPAEDADKFSWRRERMLETNDNLVKEVVRSYYESVFRTKGAERKSGIASLDEYLKPGGKYEQWFEDELSVYSLVLDEVFVVGSVPPARGAINSLADKNELQGLPYPTVYFPQFCANMGFDETGALDWACFYYGNTPEVTGDGMPVPESKDKKREQWFEIYTDQFYAIFNQDGEIKPGSLIEHGYGFLPVVRVQWGADHSAQDPIKTGHAFLRSIVKLNMGGLNAKGALQDYQYYSLYPKLVVGTKTAENIMDDGSGAATPVRHAGEESGNKAAEIPPYYLKVPIEELEALERIAYERIPAAAYRAARLRDRTTNKNVRVTQQSGLSKAFDMVPELGVLKAVSKYWQRFDLEIIRMFVRLMDGNADRVKAEYPQSFDTKSLSEIMAEITQFGEAMQKSSLPESDIATLEIAKRAYKSMIADMPEAWYNKVFDQLDEIMNQKRVNEIEPTLEGNGEPSAPLPIGEQPQFE